MKQTVRIFVNEKGEWGNPHCIVMDFGRKMNDKSRQELATKMGMSETVFVNDNSGSVNIFSTIRECPFAGSALIGTAWLLDKLGKNNNKFLTTNNVEVPFWKEDEKIFIRMNKSVLPKWNYEQLNSAKLVDKLTVSEATNKKHTFVWAWINEENGLIRARTFATDWGIPEDPANGSGSMRLADFLKREITVIHGQGSIIHARLAKNNCLEVGGLVSF